MKTICLFFLFFPSIAFSLSLACNGKFDNFPKDSLAVEYFYEGGAARVSISLPLQYLNTNFSYASLCYGGDDVFCELDLPLAFEKIGNRYHAEIAAYETNKKFSLFINYGDSYCTYYQSKFKYNKQRQ